MHSFEVHSNESACRKKVRLGLEQVLTLLEMAPLKTVEVQPEYLDYSTINIQSFG